MSGNIAVDPDKLEQLANDVVTELTDMENKYKDLHVELGQMILQCDPRYSSCFSGVGDAWSSGKALVTKLSDNEIFIRKTGDKFVEQDDIFAKALQCLRQIRYDDKLNRSYADAGKILRIRAYEICETAKRLAYSPALKTALGYFQGR